MLRTLSWIITAAALVGLVASASEISRLKSRVGEVSRHQFHDHADVRQFMIRSAVADTEQPIVVLGDSITEMAPLPNQLCGHRIINAGVGGMAIREAIPMLRKVLDGKVPYLVVLAVGANDYESSRAGEDFANLIANAGKMSPKVIAIAVSDNAQISAAAASAEIPFIDPPIDPATKMSDGVHYTAAAYRIWIPALEKAIEAKCR